MTRPPHGVSVVEALVAAGLAGVALAGLAAAGAVATHALRLARDTSQAVRVAQAQLEALRAAPQPDGTDAVVLHGTRFARQWWTSGGRGRPRAIRADVTWDRGRLVLASEVYP